MHDQKMQFSCHVMPENLNIFEGKSGAKTNQILFSGLWITKTLEKISTYWPIGLKFCQKLRNYFPDQDIEFYVFWVMCM